MDTATAANPKLNKIWWDKNKAKTLTKTGVGDSLLEFEMALDKALKGSNPADDEKTVQLKVKGAKNRVDGAIKKADKTKHKETVQALTKMFVMLDAELKKSEARAKAQPAGPKPIAVAAGGSPETIFKMSVAAQVLEKNKSKWVKDIKGWDVQLVLDSNTCDILEQEDSGPFHHQQMVDQAKKITDGIVSAIVTYIEKVDQGSATAPADKVDEARKKLDAYAKKQIQDATPRLEAVPVQVFEDFKKKNKQYLKYRVKAGVKITQGTASVALSAAALVGSHGASLAISIVGIVRGTADIAKTFYDLVLQADTVGKQLAKDVETLTKQYYDAQGTLQRDRQVATEITGTVLKSILGTDCPFLVTLPKVSANYELWDNKIAGVVLEGGKLGGRVSRTLEEMAKLETKLQNADGSTAKKVYGDLLKVRNDLDQVLTKTHKVMSQAQRFEKDGPNLKLQIDAMNDDNTKLAKVFDVVGPLLVNLGLSAAGSGLDFKAAETAKDFAKTAATFANDITAIGQSTLEAAIGK